ncbi:DUF1801 domain-containing protein [uncultured Paracoccus sp.]|uniref:DUF1801 domain-containing protein n=1 Tax=uncultured Paracoccus sp. TaxID=189685 RepID=UPI002607C006|nr:DUF1801 domain-containing protein [uncultured Paracoccus sp.]
MSDSDPPKLLAGGNPQIPKGDGNGPVQAWIAAAPGWKGEVAARIDGLVTEAVPGVRKAVKWNSPFYGAGEDGWFLSFHAMTRYLKLAFFRGASLDPPPPVGSKHPKVRYLHVGPDDLDEARLVDWVKQASRLPGEKM